MRWILPTLLLAACQPDPSDQLQQGVEFRDGSDGGSVSGERGTVKITEILWSGSVGPNRSWDPTDVFIELRNEGNRPVNVSGWHLEISGTKDQTFRIPTSDRVLNVGEEGFIAAKADGCFVDPDWVIPELAMPMGDPFRVTLRDADEHLMEPAGSTERPPFAGGYDLVTSYSMERIQLMFGGQGTEPQAWHYYNRRLCPGDAGKQGLSCYETVPNNDRVKPECRRHTLASPGRPNSPDYSGAFASGGFE